MKAIRVQLDMVYDVPDALAEDFLKRDHEFFGQIEKSFWAWEGKSGEVRVPASFDFRANIADVVEEESKNEVPST